MTLAYPPPKKNQSETCRIAAVSPFGLANCRVSKLRRGLKAHNRLVLAALFRDQPLRGQASAVRGGTIASANPPALWSGLARRACIKG